MIIESREQAIEFYESGKWRELGREERFRLQMNTTWVFMPWVQVREDADILLGRSVYTLEFANGAALIAELDGKIGKQSMADIIQKHVDIAGDKLIAVEF